MHRHGYQGRKLHRDSAQRTALLRGLAISLIEHGRIETTLPRAKELVPFVEPLITKAKKGDLASRRAVISGILKIGIKTSIVTNPATKYWPQANICPNATCGPATFQIFLIGIIGCAINKHAT
jgi:large subunit ribosomal protein L17